MKLEYAFDDEPVVKFCYNLDSKKIEVHFEGYYNLNNDIYVDTPCVWILKNWEYAKCTIGDDEKKYELDTCIGIFSLILYMKYNSSGELEMLVNTVDNRYITLFFKEPTLSLTQCQL